MMGYAHPDVLVDTQWVADHLEDLTVRIVESNYDSEANESGHIPGAGSWTWKDDFQHPVRKDIPDKAGLEALLSRSGITNDSTVVLYGMPHNAYATYAFWLLKMHGHRDVRIMDGGRDKWIGEGRPVTVEAPAITPATYRAADPDRSIRALRDEVYAAVADPERMLVDVREPEEYHGALMDYWNTGAGGMRGGHIPGAVNIPWHSAHNDDGTFRSAEELQARYTARGVTPDKEAISYCVIGGRSNQTWFVLKYLLGYPRVRLYDGSWLEWGTLVGVPIEQ
jgi:thiosulfate/3-mercaptopyruvate sulfurtransferase